MHDLEAQIADAVAALKRGAIVAIPTDTVYGIAASLEHPDAIEAIYAAKGRDAGKALPVLVDAVERIQMFTAGDLTQISKLASVFWPGALTIVVLASPAVPDGVHRGAGTVGLRMPDSDIARTVIARCGGGLAVTSANLSGRSEARTAGEVQRTLGNRLAVVVDGGSSQSAPPSTIVDVTGPDIRILREGSISRNDIVGVLSG